MLVLARIIDAARAGNISSVLELACRRLAAVHIGTDSGNWQVAERIGHQTGNAYYLPPGLLHFATRQVTMTQSLRRGGATSSGRGGSSTAGGYDRDAGPRSGYTPASSSARRGRDRDGGGTRASSTAPARSRSRDPSSTDRADRPASAHPNSKSAPRGGSCQQ
jgi:hypothetical protein